MTTTLNPAPTGTITFLFSDIEGSTRAWDRAPDRMPTVLARHDRLMRDAIAAHDGYVFATGGDGYAVAFSRSDRAIAAAIAMQRSLRSEPWPDDLPIRVRMGLNTGEVEERDGDYFGVEVNRTARLMGLAAGGQVLLSRRTADLLGVVPEGAAFLDVGLRELKDLRRPEPVVELVVDDRPGPSPAASTRPGSAPHLPAYTTSFLGRQHEIETLRSASRSHRLVTLIGPGGAGKTRLATEASHALADTYANGVWFIDLSSTPAGQVRGTLLSDLGLPSVGDWGALRRWRALVVLDNCEHVLDEAADVVEDLLTECPGVALLATSREALALPGEQVVRLDPFPTASGAADSAAHAVHLFLDRARLADPTFEPSPADLAMVAEICEGLDGLPLAIELAAARVGRYDLTDLASSLLADVPDRRSRRRDERHQGLAAVVRWSADLMDEGTRAVFRRLSVFSGDFSADAAVAVATAPGEDPRRTRAALAALVDQSMVQARRGPSGIRFSMLRTIHAFAERELDEVGERATTLDRHMTWFAGWSARLHEELGRPGWLGDVSEAPNQWAAVRHAVTAADSGPAVDLFADAIVSLLWAGGIDEAATTLRTLRTAVDPSDAVLGRRLDEAELWWSEIVGRFDRAHALTEQLRNEGSTTHQWALASMIMTHHLAAASPRIATQVVEEIEARLGAVPMADYLRAEIALGEGRFADGVESILAALRVDDVVGLSRLVGRSAALDPGVLTDLAVALRMLGRVDDAAVAADAVAECDFPGIDVYAALLQATVNCGRAPRAETASYLRRNLDLQRQWSVPLVDLDCVVHGAFVAAELGHPEVAAEVVAVTKGQPQRTLSAFGLRREVRNRVSAALGRDAFQAALERGGERSPIEAFSWLIETLDS